MTTTTSTGARPQGWRARWARTEDQRRSRAYQAALAAWQRQDAANERWLTTAKTFTAGAATGSYDGLRLTRGEAVYWEATGVGMVEPAYPPRLGSPTYWHTADARAHTVSPVPTPVVDTGALVVTSKRVIFFGRSRREWSFAKLAGLGHLPSGQTLLLVSNRKKVSGVAPPPTSITDFRLRLAIAMAEAAGDRDGFVDHLRQERDRHRQERPEPPAPVDPAQAPASAWFTGGRLAGTIAAASLLVISCCGTAAAMTGDPEPSDARAAAEAAAQSTPEVSASPTSSPSPSPSPTPTPSPTASPSPSGSDAPAPDGERSGDGSGERSGATGDCAAYVDSGGWCVDGIGDYDCEGGTGNGPNYAPEGVRLVDAGRDPFGLDRDGNGVGCERNQAPQPPPQAPQPPPPPPAPSTDPRFDTCADAKAAGYGPYYRGQTEYNWYRDADNDGVVCE